MLPTPHCGSGQLRSFIVRRREFGSETFTSWTAGSRRLVGVLRARPTPGYSLSAWLECIAADREPVDQRLMNAAVDLVETMCARPKGLEGALSRFGNTLGTDGWQIAQVSQWLQLLGQFVTRRQAKELARFSSHAAVAQGWAEGFVRGAHTGMCIDPTTGLATVMVLQLRLREVYQQCGSVGVLPSELYTLVIVDIDTRCDSRLDADLLTACVADMVIGTFHEGETIARASDRILILATNTVGTQERADNLADRLGRTPSTRRASATVVLDQLPSQPELLERYVRDLVC